MMGMVYSKASRGTVYLGEGDAASGQVLDSLEGIAAEARASANREQMRELTITERKPWATNADRLKTPFNIKAMTTCFECPWFR